MAIWPFRRETVEDVERDIVLAERSRDAFRSLLKSNRPELVRLVGDDDAARSSQLSEFREDLDDAFTDDEKLKVVQHWINKFMKRGFKHHVAESKVMRLLHELQEGV